MKSFFLLLLLPVMTMGQNSDRFLISLKDKKDKPMAYFNFYIDKVYDKRQMQDNIGTIQKGIANSRQLANFDKPLPEAFGNYFSVVLPKKEGARKLSICFYDLFVGEKTDYAGNEETGLAVAVVDFIEERDGKPVTVGRFSETAHGKSGWDITSTHDDRIKEVMQRCFNAFNNLGSEQELNIPFDPLVPQVIKSIEIPPKGIYISFADALNGNPTETEFYASENEGRFLLFSQPMRTPVNGYYGFSDGQGFYLNLGKYAGDNFYYRAEIVGPKYLVFIPNRDKELFMRIAPIVLGFSGPAIADAAISDTIPVLIDRLTGQLTMMDDSQLKRLLMPYPEIWTKFEKGPRGMSERKTALQAYFEKVKK
ncbi:hypothetical protein [Flavobacterium silvaticum]|uniref:Uncharacterized protein n=1 Tax=Flavobacterium silvaticum TaxID=1852020 RepID=A0A972FT60_9FLAO|nr:hypothetical protein [Flavobacterium silvaticum]NMH27080.1 hypothetical protein [Flavobacterium silvaticum]